MFQVKHPSSGLENGLGYVLYLKLCSRKQDCSIKDRGTLKHSTMSCILMPSKIISYELHSDAFPSITEEPYECWPLQSSWLSSSVDKAFSWSILKSSWALSYSGTLKTLTIYGIHLKFTADPNQAIKDFNADFNAINIQYCTHACFHAAFLC